jgi:hypothetical protein
MAIRDLPERYEDFEAFNEAYERDRFRFTQTNARVGGATVEMFVSWFPRLFAPVVRSVIYAMLDESVRAAFGFPRPSTWLCRVVPVLLKLRGRLAGMLPARRRPRLRTEMKRGLYPEGYLIERLGPA